MWSDWEILMNIAAYKYRDYSEAKKSAKEIDERAVKDAEPLEEMLSKIIEGKRKRTTLFRSIGKLLKKHDKENQLCNVVNCIKVAKRKSLYYGIINDEDVNYLLEIFNESNGHTLLNQEKRYTSLVNEIIDNEVCIKNLIKEYNIAAGQYDLRYYYDLYSDCSCWPKGTRRFVTAKIHYEKIKYLVSGGLLALLGDADQKLGELKKIKKRVGEKKKIRAELLDTIIKRSSLLDNKELQEAIQKAKRPKRNSPSGAISDRDLQQILEMANLQKQAYECEAFQTNEKEIEKLVKEYNEVVAFYNNMYSDREDIMHYHYAWREPEKVMKV